MRLFELVEARVEPDKKFMSQVEQIIDDSIDEYQQVLDSNGDVDDIDELEEILNQNNYDNLLPWYAQYFNESRAGRHNKQ